LVKSRVSKQQGKCSLDLDLRSYSTGGGPQAFGHTQKLTFDLMVLKSSPRDRGDVWRAMEEFKEMMMP
jgi:hypothetical protein